MQQALAQAEALADPGTLGWALAYGSLLAYLGGDVAAVQGRATALAAHATTQGLAVLVPMARVLLGWVAVQQGQATAGLAQMQAGLAAWQTTGRRAGRLFLGLLLAEAYGREGQPAAGLAVLAPWRTDRSFPGQHILEAELYRQQGVLLAATGQPMEAETCLYQALTVARLQRTTALELRAALALARLAAAPAPRATAPALLAEVYERFTEGFDTTDLQAARAWLEAGPSGAGGEYLGAEHRAGRVLADEGHARTPRVT